MDNILELPTETVALNTLRFADYNPRKKLSGNEKEALKHSIGKYGLVYPIVVNRRNNVIVGGHQRVSQLLEDGETEAEVVFVDMDEEQERRANIQLNAIEADFDPEKLQEVVYAMTPDEVEKTGFSRVEAQALLAGIYINASTKQELLEQVSEDSGEIGADDDEQMPEDDIVMFTCPQCGYKGERREFLNHKEDEEDSEED